MSRVDYTKQADERMELFLTMKKHLMHHHGVDSAVVHIMFLVQLSRLVSDEHWHLLLKLLHADAVAFNKENHGNRKVM